MITLNYDDDADEENEIEIPILPRAEVPRELDIVPLPPGPFYIKIELFLFSNFSMYIEQNSIAFVLTFVVKCRNTKYYQSVGRKVLNS